jgi:hypothetical protein
MQPAVSVFLPTLHQFHMCLDDQAWMQEGAVQDEKRESEQTVKFAYRGPLLAFDV